MVAVASALVAIATPALAQDSDAAGPLTAYVQARAADAEGRIGLAAAGYARALAADPDNAAIANRAWREGIAAGDFTLARRALATLTQAGNAPADAVLFQLADALQRGDTPAAEAALARMREGPFAFLAPIVAAWLAHDGKGNALAMLDAQPAQPVAARYVSEARILLAAARGDVRRTRAALATHERARVDLPARVAAAQALHGRGRHDAADALLPGTDRGVVLLRGALARSQPVDARFGVARLYARIAQDLTAEEIRPLALLLARSALYLAPADEPTRVRLAVLLAEEGAGAQALAELDRIGRDAPFSPLARRAELRLLAAAGRDAEALALATMIAAADDRSIDAARAHGEALSVLERHDEAAAALATAIERAGNDAPWRLYFERGVALDKAGDWARAEPLFERARALSPDQPELLLYLSRSQLLHGGDPQSARAMLERANALRPDDAETLGALGWAFSLSGDHARALDLFARAVRGAPADATIHERHGDALWRAGRRIDARYAWRAAAVFADDGAAARIAARIADGLPAVAR